MRPANGLLTALALGAAACPIWNGTQGDQRPVGATTVALPLDKAINRSQESLFGDVCADAYLASGADAGAVAALFNGGSIRCEAPSFDANADNQGCKGQSVPPGNIDRLLLSDVIPFESADDLVVVRLTGAELKSTLERSVASLPSKASGWFMQVSGLTYTADCAQPAQVIDPNYPSVLRVISDGSRVGAIVLGGKLVDPADTTTTYDIVTNSFEAQGSDGHVAMGLACQTQQCQPFDPSSSDYVVIASYLGTNDPISPTLQGRITLSPSCQLKQ